LGFGGKNGEKPCRARSALRASPIYCGLFSINGGGFEAFRRKICKNGQITLEEDCWNRLKVSARNVQERGSLIGFLDVN